MLASLSTEVKQHTLLSRMYIYPYFSDNYGYILEDKCTSQLIIIDCGDF